MTSCCNWQILWQWQLVLQRWHHHFSQFHFISLKLRQWLELLCALFPEYNPYTMACFAFSSSSCVICQGSDYWLAVKVAVLVVNAATLPKAKQLLAVIDSGSSSISARGSGSWFCVNWANDQNTYMLYFLSILLAQSHAMLSVHCHVLTVGPVPFDCPFKVAAFVANAVTLAKAKQLLIKQ